MLNRMISWMLVRLFAFGSRDRILNAVFVALCLLGLALLFAFLGPSTLAAFIRYRLDPTFDVKSIAAPTAAAIVIISGAAYLGKHQSVRATTALAVLVTLRSVFNGLTASGIWVARHRTITTPMAIVSLLVAASLGSLAISHEITNASIRTEGDAYVGELYRFVERRPISSLSVPYADALHLQYVRLAKQPLLGLQGIKGCKAQLARSIDSVFSIASPNTADLRDAAEAVIQPLDQGVTFEQDVHCEGDDLSRSYYRLWLARLLLVRSQQGQQLDRVIHAHALLIKAQPGFSTAGSAAAENSLSNVYVFYLLNFETLSRSFWWDSLASTPQPGAPPRIKVPFFDVINEAQKHMALAQQLESKKDSSFADTRLKINLGELMRLLLRRRDKPYVALTADGFDPLAAVNPPLLYELHDLRSNPLQWLAHEKSALRDRLIGQQVPEGFVTLAQLGCLEMELATPKDSSGPAGAAGPQRQKSLSPPTPLEAMKTAIYMGFRDPEFFLNQSYRGMCPLIASSDGPEYVSLVTTHLKIDERAIRSSCTP